MSIGLKQQIEHLEGHIFIEKEEEKLLTDLKNKIKIQALSENEHKFLKQLEINLSLRESNPDKVIQQIQQFGQPLESINHDIDLSIEKEQKSQNTLANFLLISFIICCIMIVSAIFILVLKEVDDYVGLLSFVIAIFSLSFIAFILSRLFQNTREASERMDEKSIALKFIKTGLFYFSEKGNPILFEKGINMFLNHHSTKSKPIDDNTFKIFTDGLQQMNEKTTGNNI